jgi:hypothetical protein
MEIDIMRVGHHIDVTGMPIIDITPESLADIAEREPDKYRFDKGRGVLVCIRPEIIKGFDEAKLKELSVIKKNTAAAAKKMKEEFFALMS